MRSIDAGIHPTIHPSQLVRARFSSGKISIPVKPSQAIYARFKHVSGTPAYRGGGVSLNKLRGLDILIDRLISVKESSSSPERRARIDSMIKSLRAGSDEADIAASLQSQAEVLHQLAVPGNGYQATIPNPQGLVFQFTA